MENRRSQDEPPLSALELSPQASACLELAGISTISQLLERSAHDLLSMRNFGESTLQEVRERLAVSGLNLMNDHWGYADLWHRLDEAMAVLENEGVVTVNSPRRHAIGFLYRCLIKYDLDRGEMLSSFGG